MKNTVRIRDTHTDTDVDLTRHWYSEGERRVRVLVPLYLYLDLVIEKGKRCYCGYSFDSSSNTGPFCRNSEILSHLPKIKERADDIPKN